MVICYQSKIHKRLSVRVDDAIVLLVDDARDNYAVSSIRWWDTNCDEQYCVSVTDSTPSAHISETDYDVVISGTQLHFLRRRSVNRRLMNEYLTEQVCAKFRSSIMTMKSVLQRLFNYIGLYETPREVVAVTRRREQFCSNLGESELHFRLRNVEWTTARNSLTVP